ncbi:MAG: hypothetical protein ABL952_17765, partial [Pyrinomonadaceae bacterium]
KIKSVYFLAYTKRDRELCDAVFERLGLQLETKKVEKTSYPSGPNVATANAASPRGRSGGPS